MVFVDYCEDFISVQALDKTSQSVGSIEYGGNGKRRDLIFG
jgi:hypothetical protein